MNPTLTEFIMNNCPQAIFVFGSNLAGRHGKGAAKAAVGWGAVYGQGVGAAGRTYAIPTKDGNLKVRSLQEIQASVNTFIDFARSQPERLFLVTEIGTGLAGYTHKEIAELFPEYGCIPSNVCLPYKFREHMKFYMQGKYEVSADCELPLVLGNVLNKFL